MNEAEINNESIHFMVEDFWRSFLTTAQSDPTTAQNTVIKFEAQISSLASMMTMEKSNIFVAAIDKERELIFDEYKRSPEALKIRLGLYDSRPIRGDLISASDHDAIINATRLDYTDLQVIARGTGSLSERAEKVDRELNLRISSHTANMSMEDQAEFTKHYNLEYNRLVMARLKNKQGNSGCALVIMTGVGISAALGALGQYLF